MKYWFEIFVAVTLSGIISLGLVVIYPETIERTYCGSVSKMYMTASAYKISAKPHVVFYCDSAKRFIDVTVSHNTYANIQVNSRVCFDLSKAHLRE